MKKDTFGSQITDRKDMTLFAIYLFFVAILMSYQGSKYWPKNLPIITKAKHVWICCLIMVGTILFVYSEGIAVGVLSVLMILMSFFQLLYFSLIVKDFFK